MIYRPERNIGGAKRNHSRRVTVHYCTNIGSRPVDFCMNIALRVLRSSLKIDGIAIQVVLDDILRDHEFRCP